jgi:hypothetical protein
MAHEMFRLYESELVRCHDIEFDGALKTLSVKESLPINNETIQQFLSG